MPIPINPHKCAYGCMTDADPLGITSGNVYIPTLYGVGLPQGGRRLRTIRMTPDSATEYAARVYARWTVWYDLVTPFPLPVAMMKEAANA